ncbi:unnamed protein product [Leptosia nina]|uniref:Peptidase S1 domain-containing protein n=1 Tax=Leptosia nina TaxID=320188 RepID=A0AAV1IVT1_9NEOP
MSFIILILCLYSVGISGRRLPEHYQGRIINGDVTTIDQYPSAAVPLLYDCFINVYREFCGASIINSRTILTAAHCIVQHVPISYWQMRVGSTFSNRGGVVHPASKIFIYPYYNSRTEDNDIGLIQTSVPFSFNSLVSPARIAEWNYYLPDGEPVTAVGWGMNDTSSHIGSDQLRKIHLNTINWKLCDTIFQKIGLSVDENMLCIGIPGGGVGGQCGGDSGSPVYHNDVIVGVCSWGHEECDNPNFPHVNMLVSRYAYWIKDNAK